MEEQKKDNRQLIINMGDVFHEMRKDLGYMDTECTTDDFIHLVLTDWHKVRDEYISS